MNEEMLSSHTGNNEVSTPVNVTYSARGTSGAQKKRNSKHWYKNDCLTSNIPICFLGRTPFSGDYSYNEQAVCGLFL